MSKKRIRFPNGDSILIDEGVDVDAAVDYYVDQMMKEAGVTAPPNTAALGQQAANEAGAAWMDENPNAGLAASFQGGARNIGRNLAQMALPKSMESRFGVDTQSNQQAAQMEAPLREKAGGMYTAGEIVPTLAVPGSGQAKAGASVLRHALAPWAGRSAVEGAAYGAAVAGPENRYSGAALGAAGGAAGSVLAKTLGRLGKGVAPMTEEAKRVLSETAKIKGAEKPFLPAAVATSLTGEGGATKYLYDSLLYNIPAASRRMNAQKNEVLDTTRRNMLRGAFGAETGAADAMVRAGSMQRGVDTGISELTEQGLKPGRAPKILEAASRGATGNPTMQQISSHADRIAGGRGKVPPLQDLARSVDAVMNNTSPEGGLALRHLVNALIRVGNVATLTLVSKGLTTKSVQNYMMGNTWWQKPIQKALKAGDEAGVQSIMERVAREAALSGSAGSIDDMEASVRSAYDGAMEAFE